MKFIIKVRKYSLLHCCLIFILAGIPITASAQEIVETVSTQEIVETSSPAQNIVDTSSPWDPLVNPTIVVEASTVEPDCHSWTGCDVMVVKTVVKKHFKSHHHYKPKRHCVVYPSPCGL